MLQALSPDDEAAAHAFLRLRDSLVRFFELKGDNDPIQAADETLDRVSTKLGEQVQIENITKYSFGVARLVFLEDLRKIQRADKAMADYGREIERQTATDDTDHFSRMRECFGKLSDANKGLMRSYFADLPRAELDAARRALADSMNASLNNLRLKIFRLRRQLEECIRGGRD